MADLENQFRAALEADSEGPTDPQGAADEPEMTCPMCGASATKIQQAAGGAPPSGPMGLMK